MILQQYSESEFQTVKIEIISWDWWKDEVFSCSVDFDAVYKSSSSWTFLEYEIWDTLVQNCNKQKHIMENYSNKRENSELKRGIEIGFSTYVTVASLIADTLFLGSEFRVYMLISPRSEESKNSLWVVIQSEIFFWVIYFNYMILELLVSCEIKYQVKFMKSQEWKPIGFGHQT